MDERELDRLLEEASAEARDASPPAGFADRVMGGIAREELLLNRKNASRVAAGASHAHTGVNFTFGQLAVFCTAAAALLAVAFFLGREFTAHRNANSNNNNIAGESPRNAESGRGAIKFENSDGGKVTIDQLANELDAGARGDVNVKGGNRHESPGSRMAADRARGEHASPSTLAGRFPRSADRRVYVVIDVRDAGMALPTQKPVAGAWTPPAMRGYAAYFYNLPIAEAEKLLVSLDGRFKEHARAHLAGFSNSLLPVNGVVTPPRVDYNEPTPPAPGDDSVEVVIYAQL